MFLWGHSGGHSGRQFQEGVGGGERENEIHIVSMGVWSEVGMGAEGILERGDLSVYLSIYIYTPSF